MTIHGASGQQPSSPDLIRHLAADGSRWILLSLGVVPAAGFIVGLTTGGLSHTARIEGFHTPFHAGLRDAFATAWYPQLLLLVLLILAAWTYRSLGFSLLAGATVPWALSPLLDRIVYELAWNIGPFGHPMSLRGAVSLVAALAVIGSLRVIQELAEGRLIPSGEAVSHVDLQPRLQELRGDWAATGGRMGFPLLAILVGGFFTAVAMDWMSPDVTAYLTALVLVGLIVAVAWVWRLLRLQGLKLVLLSPVVFLALAFSHRYIPWLFGETIFHPSRESLFYVAMVGGIGSYLGWALVAAGILLILRDVRGEAASMRRRAG